MRPTERVWRKPIRRLLRGEKKHPKVALPVQETSEYKRRERKREKIRRKTDGNS